MSYAITLRLSGGPSLVPCELRCPCRHASHESSSSTFWALVQCAHFIFLRLGGATADNGHSKYSCLDLVEPLETCRWSVATVKCEVLRFIPTGTKYTTMNLPCKPAQRSP